MADSDRADFDKQVQSWHEAISSEFDAVESGDSAAILEKMKIRLLKNMSELTEELLSLAQYASSESVRLNAIKLAHEMVAGKDGTGKGDFASMLRELQKAPTNPPNE